MIQRAGAHFDQNFVCVDLRIGDVRKFQDFRTAVIFKDDCFHRRCKEQSGKGKADALDRKPAVADDSLLCPLLFALCSKRYRAASIPFLTSLIASLIMSIARPRWPPLSAAAYCSVFFFYLIPSSG